MYEIDKKDWHTCKLCNKKISDLAKIYGGSNVYYTTVFKRHLKKDHNINLEDYFSNRPICNCGICYKKTNILIIGSNLKWRKFACGRYPGLQKWSEDAKISRKGIGNPMYGKIPWNKGLDNTNEIIRRVSQAKIGIKASEETKKKQSISAKKRLVNGHTGYKHSEETKEKSRQRTLNMIKSGFFKQVKSKPAIKMSEILTEMQINFKQEEIRDCWSFDFYLTDFNIFIEVDGDYFHSNPRIYPDGPKTKTQKINWYRDIKKNQYCKDNGLILLRFWECDILNNDKEIKEKIKCIVNKL